MSEVQDIKTLQEIFGITVTEAENSYNYYNKSLNAAIQGLSSDTGVRSGPENRNDSALTVRWCDLDNGPAEELSTHTLHYFFNEGDGSSAAPSNVASGSDNNTIDLTTAGSGEDDLQKALALSLLDMNRSSGRGGSSSNSEPISQEEQDLSRALEASLADNQDNMSRLGMSYTSYEPLNPYERKRDKDKPVGLKNIGNTCWFASVIQSLFYIPQFRDCILSFVVPDIPDQLPCVKFVEELQKLFALLLKSNERYINPKPAIDVLYSVFNNASGSQQDVSEFTHKLLEWMEDAFSQTKHQPNPIIDLFTGQCVTEGLLNDQPFVNKSQFGAFPVQVEGHTDLHDSLEAATVNNEIQQETWFTHLPQILVIELSRFKYNQTSGQAEKIHDQLMFDLVLHMDRYLQDNCQESREMRQEMAKLREKKNQFVTALRSYTNYNGKSISLVEVLSLALNFVRSANEETDGDNYEHSPVPKSGSYSDITTTGTCLHEWMTEIESDISEIQDKLDVTNASLNSVYSDQLMKDTPYKLHAVLVHQGEASGGHYWAYVRKTYTDDNSIVEQTVIQEDDGQQPVDSNGEIEECVVTNEEEEDKMEVETITTTDTTDNVTTSHLDPIDTSLTNMLDVNKDISLDDAIDSVPSFNTEKDEFCSNVVTGDWLKCNDISVTEVTWDEVKRESFGRIDCNDNNNNTSAYCLVYISNDTAQGLIEKRDTIIDLNDSLVKYVSSSNQSFDKALADYDIKKSQKQESEKENGFIKPAKLVRFESPNVDVSNFAQKILDTNPSEAKRARSDSLYNSEKDNSDNNSPPQKEVDPLLITQLRAKMSQKYHLLTCELPDSIKESRLLSEFRYATDCGFSEKVRQAILLNDVSIEAQTDEEMGLLLLAKKEYFNLLQDVSQDLELVRRMYKLFGGVCYHFLNAIELIKKDKDWCRALPHVMKSYSMNSEIRQISNSHCALRNDFLVELRSKVVLMVSQKGTVCFKSGNISLGLSIGNTCIVPAIKELCTTQASESSEQLVEKIREDWCKCLDQSTTTEDDTDKLADLLVKIVEDYSKALDMELPETPESYNSQLLVSAFSNAFKYFLTDIIP